MQILATTTHCPIWYPTKRPTRLAAKKLRGGKWERTERGWRGPTNVTRSPSHLGSRNGGMERKWVGKMESPSFFLCMVKAIRDWICIVIVWTDPCERERADNCEWEGTLTLQLWGNIIFSAGFLNLSCNRILSFFLSFFIHSTRAVIRTRDTIHAICTNLTPRRTPVPETEERKNATSSRTNENTNSRTHMLDLKQPRSLTHTHLKEQEHHPSNKPKTKTLEQRIIDTYYDNSPYFVFVFVSLVSSSPDAPLDPQASMKHDVKWWCDREHQRLSVSSIRTVFLLSPVIVVVPNAPLDPQAPIKHDGRWCSECRLVLIGHVPLGIPTHEHHKT